MNVSMIRAALRPSRRPPRRRRPAPAIVPRFEAHAVPHYVVVPTPLLHQLVNATAVSPHPEAAAALIGLQESGIRIRGSHLVTPGTAK